MTNPAQSKRDVDASTLVGAAPLDSILCTEELLRRPSRPIDHEKENSALSAMVCALADSPHTILQTLADKILEVLQADSAGLSLLRKMKRGSTGRLFPASGGLTSAVAPRAISAHAAMCSTATFLCYSLIGSGVILI